MDENRTYLAIDLKSFFASVECVERGLDPLTTHLVVADNSRTEKTICLAVSPSLKAYGIPGRARLFEVVRKIKEVNALRLQNSPNHSFTDSSCDAPTLEREPELRVDYIVAPPRMSHYISYSTRVYQVYLKYVAPEDIHIYSIDEVFIDATSYLPLYGLTPRAFAGMLIRDVLRTTGITATAGIGTNLYLCKVAMDIVAKHVPADKDGVRIAKLDEHSYRRLLWAHRPLTDFWRVGQGCARKLETHGIYTMGDIARCSLGGSDDFLNENLLYRLFGINAELLIDHAWGWESCTMADIKSYRSDSVSICSGQVLHHPYTCEKARIIVREMADSLALQLTEHGLVTNQITLTVGYDTENLRDETRRKNYTGSVVTDSYGRPIPKHAHGAVRLQEMLCSSSRIMQAVSELYDRITNPTLLVRRINLSAANLTPETDAAVQAAAEQLDLFEDNQHLARERRQQQAILSIKKKYGKNAILRGMNLLEESTARERNRNIGGHKA